MRLERFGDRVSLWFERTMPDPFTLALLLSLLIGLAALFLGESFPPGAAVFEKGGALAEAWKSYLFEPRGANGKVIQGYLYFGFQMCVMLVTGHALASTPMVAKGVKWAASRPSSARGGVYVVAFVACGSALVHWALGLIVGALMAREVGRVFQRRGIPVHYPVLGAAGYTGLMIWGGGRSGSIPLKAMSYQPPAYLAEAYPFGEGGVPQELTLFSPLNLAVCLVLLFFVPWIASRLHPGAGSPVRGIEDSDAQVDEVGEEVQMSTVQETSILKRLEQGRVLSGLVGLIGLGIVFSEWLNGEFKLSFNQLNVIFLFGGLLLHRSLKDYVSAVSEGVSGCAGILLQFPFYFAIIGMLLVSGLGSQISQAIVSWTTESTYPVATFLSAGFVNLVVPSGGGQWLVQKDIVMEGALAYQDMTGRAIMAMAYGDGWSNMLQPFWAIPLLAITGLKAREIVGYTAVIMLVSGGVIAGFLTFF